MVLFGKRLKELRKAKNMTQLELGEAIGVTKVSICCYEKGTRIPTLDTLYELSNVLGVSYNYLLGNDSFQVAEDDPNYGINISKEDLKLIKTLKKHEELYKKLICETDRTLRIIEQKMR